jgi:hypothetical protein
LHRYRQSAQAEGGLKTDLPAAQSKNDTPPVLERRCLDAASHGYPGPDG